MSFPPLVGNKPKVLILGTMPGRRSLELNQYYANPQNAFWYIMGNICGASPDLTYSQRCTRLRDAGIALWDVLKYCERQGSLDSRITRETEIPNQLTEFIQLHPTIRAVCFNGNKAAKIFDRSVYPILPDNIRGSISLEVLPSTSSANTHHSKLDKLTAWKTVIGSFIRL